MIDGITFEPGYMVVTQDGIPRRHHIANMLRAADIPTGLTHTQVASITSLANLLVVLIKSLMSKDILNESFLDDGGYNLDDLIESIEHMGGDFENPQIKET